MEESYIKICIVGEVSSGKSTLVNSFFLENYSECKIKRTTMLPIIFKEADNPDDFVTIKQKIINRNNEIISLTENGKTLDNCEELMFNAPRVNIKITNDGKLCIYDIPGLNDANTKYLYYKYLLDNFHKFNIILFVVNIQSGLNTSDEMDIIEFLAFNIKKYEVVYEKNIKLLVIANKSDNMYLENTDVCISGELKEMFEQTKKSIMQKIDQHEINSNFIGCFPLCAVDAYLYGMIKKYGNGYELTDDNILKIGTNQLGTSFRRKTKKQQQDEIKKIISNATFVEEMIELSGYYILEKTLRTLLQQHHKNLIRENYLYTIKQLPLSNTSTYYYVENFISKMKIILNIKKYDIDAYNIYSEKLYKSLNDTLIFNIPRSENNKRPTYHIPMFWNIVDTHVVNPKIIVVSNNILDECIQYYEGYKSALTQFSEFQDVFDIERVLYTKSYRDHVYCELLYMILNNSISYDVFVKIKYYMDIELFALQSMELYWSQDIVYSLLKQAENRDATSIFQNIDAITNVLKFIEKNDSVSCQFIELVRYLLIIFYDNLVNDHQCLEKIQYYESHEEFNIRHYLQRKLYLSSNHNISTYILTCDNIEDYKPTDLESFYIYLLKK